MGGEEGCEEVHEVKLWREEDDTIGVGLREPGAARVEERGGVFNAAIRGWSWDYGL